MRLSMRGDAHVGCMLPGVGREGDTDAYSIFMSRQAGVWKTHTPRPVVCNSTHSV